MQPKQPQRAARVLKKRPLLRLKNYFRHHLNAASFSLLQILKSPVATLLTVATIGVTLALPLSMILVLSGIQSATEQWQHPTQVSIFLPPETRSATIDELTRQIGQWEEVEQVVHMTPAAALEEFKSFTGLDDALALLDDNPFPNVLIISPAKRVTDPQQAQALVDKVAAIPGVDKVEFDLQWVQRIHALVRALQYALFVLALLLAGAVLFTIGNTIRLTIHSRRDEIELVKLIGASDAFVRRPFLYGGLWYGFLGAFFAWILIGLIIYWMNTPLAQLVQLYGGVFQVPDVSLGYIFASILFSIFLGVLGAWLTVGRHLRFLAPR